MKYILVLKVLFLFLYYRDYLNSFKPRKDLKKKKKNVKRFSKEIHNYASLLN